MNDTVTPVLNPDENVQREEEFSRRIALVEEAIDLHGAHIFRYLLSLTRNHHDAEDLQTQLFTRALHRFPEEKIKNLPMLRKRAYFLFVDLWRKKKRSPITPVEEVPEIPALPSQDEGILNDEELKTRFFEEHPAPLSEEQRELLWLSARGGYTHAEIAVKVGKPVSTIGDQIRRARQIFVDYFNQS